MPLLQLPVPEVTRENPILCAPESTTSAVVGSVNPIEVKRPIPVGEESQALGRPEVESAAPASGRPMSRLQVGPPRRETEAAAVTCRQQRVG